MSGTFSIPTNPSNLGTIDLTFANPDDETTMYYRIAGDIICSDVSDMSSCYYENLYITDETGAEDHNSYKKSCIDGPASCFRGGPISIK